MRPCTNDPLTHIFPVSIHASVKDATPLVCGSLAYYAVSIHASVKDATLISIDITKIINSFNPRICKRCDDFKYCSRLRKYVSIHASVKDATLGYARLLLTVNVSIHASVKDATYANNERANLADVSIHASVKDATLREINFSISLTFQSTHL